MKRAKLVNNGCWLMLTISLGSCGPLYSTDYVFKPPRSESGSACVFQCENGRLQCRQLEDLKADRCQYNSDTEREYCEADLAWRKGRDPKWYECIPESCDVDYNRCDESYRYCFQSCGGKVETVARCVANCPPPVVSGTGNATSK